METPIADEMRGCVRIFNKIGQASTMRVVRRASIVLRTNAITPEGEKYNVNPDSAPMPPQAPSPAPDEVTEISAK